jgi:drug/metabolite transporter (DMT)-like permease
MIGPKMHESKSHPEERSAQPGPGTAPGTSSGVMLGMLAVVLWAFGSSLVYCGAKEAGTWPFVTIGSLTGGLIQMAFRRVAHGELVTAIRLPWRLWAVPVVCFVIYGLAWPWALATADPAEVLGVNLINYLWPVLTVVFSAWWVPGVRLTGRTFLALGLALAGLLFANLPQLREVMHHTNGQEANHGILLPFALSALAAVTWAVYSSVLVRWRTWAQRYVTSPIGFILTGLVAGLVMAWTAHWPSGLSFYGGLMTFLYAAGPLAAGYLLWELALPKTKVETLSLIAATTPVLSTFILCVFLKTRPGAELVIAALLVSAGVLLSRRA